MWILTLVKLLPTLITIVDKCVELYKKTQEKHNEKLREKADADVDAALVAINNTGWLRIDKSTGRVVGTDGTSAVSGSSEGGTGVHKSSTQEDK